MALDLIGSILRGCTAGAEEGVDAAISSARGMAMPLMDGPRADLARSEFVAAALVRLAAETEVPLMALGPALATLETEFGIDRLEIGIRALSDPLLLDLPLDAAVEAVVALVRLLAPVESVSLWRSERDTYARLEPGMRVARVKCWRYPCAVLAFVPGPGREAECQAIADRAAALLAPAFERASLVEGNVARSEALLATSERRLTRLGFDLHDGPLQDVAVLAGSLDVIHRHVGAELGDTPLGKALLSALDDAAAIAHFLDGELRDLATSLDGSGLARKRFDDLLASVVRKFIARASAEVDLEIVGETDALTESQKITLLRIVQEALANIREHSDARNVRVAIDARGSHVQATISDDGRGFVVEEGMLDAGRNGRMGLAGMVERVRLLGGVCDIVSRPGGGTQISLSVARWVPVAGAHEPRIAPANADAA